MPRSHGGDGNPPKPAAAHGGSPTSPRIRPTQAAAFRRHATMPPGVKVVTEAGQLESELRFLLPALTQKESDQTWNGINDALERWKLLTKEGGAYKLHDAYFACLRRIQAHVVSAILSDRSKLSRTAVELVECLAVLFRQNFEPFAEVFVTAVLKLSTRANRVFVSSATQCLRTVVEHCPVPGLLEAFLEALQNKNKTMRACAAEAAAACVEHTPLPLLQDHVDEIEQFVATAVEDAESSVRDWARSCFALYAERFASRLEGFQARLSPKARKYLAVAATEQTKRTSVFDARLQAQRARDKRTVGMGSFLAGSDGAKDPHADVYGVGPAARLQLSKPLEGVGAGKSLPADPSAGALGAARRKARPSVAPGLDDRDASDARRSESSANTSSASINVKDVLDKSGSTIANALLHAQRVPKVPVDTASQASRGPVRRLAGNGAQRVAVGAKPDAEKAISEVKVQENSAHLAPADPTPAPKPALTDAKARDQTEKARFGTLPEAPSTFTERPRSAIPVLSLTVHEGSTRAGGRGVDDSFDHLHGTSVKPALASFRAPLWSVRLQAFENLASRLKDLGTDGDLPAAKTADILDTGLDDTHTKVALAAMECLKAFLERHPADAKLLDLVLGKVIGSLRASSASQSRSSATNAANDVLDILKRTCDADVLLASSLNILSSSEWSKVSRVRMGALDLAASLIQDHPALLLRAQVMRSVVHKLAAFVPDVDATSSRRLRSLLLTLEASSSESFFAAATSLKPSERKLLRSILIKDITDWDAKEKHAFAKLHATDAAPQASESILYPETTSLAAPPLPRSPTKADTQETLVLSSDQRSISDAKLLADEPCVQETEIDRPAALESEHSFIVDIPEQPSANVISNVFEARPSPPADVSLIAFDKSLHLAANGLPSHAMDQEDQDNDFSRDLIAFDVSIIARVAVPLLEEEPPKDLFELGSPFTGDVDSGNRELANAGSAPEAPLDHELPTAEDVRDISEGNATSAALTVAASEGASLVATADPATTIPDRELDAMGVEGEDVELTENVPEARFQHIDDSSLEPDLDSLPPMHYEGKPSVASSPVTSPFLNDSGLEAPLSSVLPEQQVHTAVSETEFPGPSMQDLGEDPCLGDAAVQLELTAVAEKDRVDVQALEELVAQLQASLAEQTEITETLRKDLDDRASEHERAREAASEALAALEQLRERHQADFAAEFSRLSAEHKTLVDDLRAAYEARIAALSQPVEPVSEVPELLATALRELEMAMASAASDKQLFAARIAQLEAEASIRDQYLAEVEKRAAVEKTELEAIWRVRVAEANQRNTEMAELLQDAETAYEQLHRAYAAAVAMPEESMGVNETEEAEDEVIGSPDHAMELLTCGDIAVGAFSYLLTISQPIDLTGETLALICDMAKRAETDGLTLCKCLLLLQDSIAINPAVVENNEEIVIDSIALGACAVPCVASQFVPDIRLCLERLVETTANAIVPHRLSYSVHYILSLDFASTTPYVQSLFTKLVLLMKDTDGERLASRIASMIMPALRSSDIELRKTAFESLGQLHTHVGQTLLRELAQAMSVKPDPMLRHLVRKRLGVSEEDLALDETF
ncbi:clasp N terminal-domain-containing protein [Hyaloraphidium curvatum]|nr:clasp N terminal-domain-containing protein [Hyaloraphidium curvatum]